MNKLTLNESAKSGSENFTRWLRHEQMFKHPHYLRVQKTKTSLSAPPPLGVPTTQPTFIG